ncbi:hypothetical protein NDU88_007512 [Pleurodeles waltl]|uniref:Uncharacterized protein n=1 Tax=Pleurodeles waltl TaxID=8319 RepID=A0AAV7N2F0_PLEWA|nr:hypothetical protein NDU88_007512 [Pleurodeles waltl]
MKQIRPWPVVVVPQGLLRRGRRVSLLVSSLGGGIHLGSLQSSPLNRRCSLELPHAWLGGRGKLRRSIGGRGGGGSQGAHPPLFQSLRPHPARHSRQNSGRSSRLRSAPRQPLCPAARSRPEPSARGERSQQRIPPQGCDSGAPGAPRKYLRAEPERSA